MIIKQETKPPAHCGEKSAEYWDTQNRTTQSIGQCVVGADWLVEFMQEGQK